MKRFTLVLALVLVGFLAAPSYALEKPGAIFKRAWKRLLARFDTNHDGQISKTEVEAVLAAEKAKHAEKQAEKTGTAQIDSGTRAAKEMKEIAFVVHKFVKDFDSIANGEGIVTEAAFKTWFEALAAELQAKKQAGQQTPAPGTPTPAPAPDAGEK
jgi:hypothetical protein